MKLVSIMLLLFLFISTTAKDKEPVLALEFKYADCFKRGKLDSALYFIKLERTLMPKPEDLYALQLVEAEIYMIKSKYEKSFSILEELEKQIVQEKGSQHSQLITLLHLKARHYDNYQDRPNQKESAERAFKIATAIYPETHLEVGKCFNELGYYYTRILNLEKGIEFIDKSKAIFLKTVGSDDLRLVKVYNTYIMYHNALTDYRNLEKYIDLKHQILSKNLPPDHDQMMESFADIGTMKYYNGEHNEALMYLQKAIQILNKNHKNYVYPHIDIYNNISSIWLQLKEFDKALECSKISLAARRSIFGNESLTQWHTLNYLGRIYSKMGDHPKAIETYKKAIFYTTNKLQDHRTPINLADSYFEIDQPQNGIKYLELAEGILESKSKPMFYQFCRINQYYAKYYRKINNKSKALDAINLAINQSVGLESKAELDQIPEYYQFKNKFGLLNSLMIKGNILEENKEDTLSLKAALNTYALALNAVDTMKSKLSSGASRNRLSEEAAPIFDKAIATTFALWEITQNEQYIDKAFLLIERSKALDLLKNIINGLEKDKSSENYTLFEKEQSLKTKYSYYYGKFRKLPVGASDSLKNAYQNKIFNLNKQRDSLHQSIIDKTGYSFIKKNTINPISLRKAQQRISEKTVLFSYFYGEESIYSIGITKNKLQFEKIVRTDSLVNTIEGYNKELQEFDYTGYSEYKVKEYSLNSLVIYKALLEPILKDKKDIKNLIIIPDGKLSMINFSALTYELAAEEKSNFLTLPYLIRKYNIQYHYSSSLHFIGSSFENDRAKVNCLAMAPFKQGKRNLVASEKELTEISNHFNGNFLSGNQATKAAFLDLHKAHQILHLATHALADTKNPNLSRLTFHSEDKPKPEKHFLYNYEIQNLPIEASLVVLSACETGIGKYQHGEGVMSLARSFLYAGAASVLMSQWKIEDHASSKIMQYFYENIAQRKSKNEALRNAKLAYLDNADHLTAHPAFWAGIAFIGNNSPIDNGTNNSLVLLLLTLAVCGIAYLVYRRKFVV